MKQFKKKKSNFPTTICESNCIDFEYLMIFKNKCIKKKTPEKVRRIANMVFLHGVLEDPLVQHQGGGCSQYDVYGRV